MRHYFENHDNVAECHRKLLTDFRRRAMELTVRSICSLSCEKVKETGILNDKPKRENPKTVRTPENIAAVAESV